MNENFHLWLIPMLPFAGFLLNGLFGSRLSKPVVTAIAILASLGSLLVVLADFGTSFRPDVLPHVETYGHWITAGTLHIDFSFVLDQLSLVMLLIITGVGFLIHIYSVGYMHDDPGYARYFAYMNLFMFFMTVLVLAGNALLLFVGWEGVGLASYLLIGFWFQKTSAATPVKRHSSLTVSATLASLSVCSCCWPTSAHSHSAKSLRNWLLIQRGRVEF